MTPTIENTLVAQREKLCQQLQEQRRLIARQLLPMQTASSHYPRSMTVRFLTRQQPLVTKLFAEIMLVIVGVRLYKFLTAMLVLVRIMTSGSSNSQKRLESSVRHRTE